MKEFLSVLCFILILTVSCKKDEEKDKVIGSIGISDARMLVFGTVEIDPYSSKDPADSVDLFKITEADEVLAVPFYYPDGGALNNELLVDGVYKLDTSFFLLNVYDKTDVSKKISSYVIQKQTGNAVKSKETIIPHQYIHGNWSKGSSNAGFVTSENLTFYIPDDLNVNKLVISIVEETFEVNVSKISIHHPIFECNANGDILAEKLLYTSGGAQVAVPEMKDNVILAKKYEGSFYVLANEGDTLWISALAVNGQEYTIYPFDTLAFGVESINFIGNANMRALHGNCWIFDKSIVYIDTDSARVVPFKDMSLKTIESYFVSDNALFVKGKNTLNNEVFLKILPSSKPLLFSTLFAPDNYIFYTIDVESDGRFCYYAYQKNMERNVFGYRMSTAKTGIVVNDLDIIVRQILTVK